MVSRALRGSQFRTAVSDHARDSACRVVHLVAHETREIACIHWSCLVLYFIEVQKSPRHLQIEKPAPLFVNVAYTFIFHALVSLDSMFPPGLCRHILPRMDDSPPDVPHSCFMMRRLGACDLRMAQLSVRGAGTFHAPWREQRSMFREESHAALYTPLVTWA